MKKKTGRPRSKVDEILLEKLSKLHLSDKVIADVVGVSVWTLQRRFAQKMETWRSQGKSKMAEVLFDEAINKREPWALKALAHKHLDYADKVEQKADITATNTDRVWIAEIGGVHETDDTGE